MYLRKKTKYICARIDGVASKSQNTSVAHLIVAKCVCPHYKLEKIYAAHYKQDAIIYVDGMAS